MLRRVATGAMWAGGGVLALTAWAAGTSLAMSMKVQRLRPYDEIQQRLTGQIGVEEGSPIMIVVLDNAALIEREGKIPAIDASRHFILQLRTVLYLAGVLAILCLAALLAGGVLLWLTRVQGRCVPVG